MAFTQKQLEEIALKRAATFPLPVKKPKKKLSLEKILAKIQKQDIERFGERAFVAKRPEEYIGKIPVAEREAEIRAGHPLGFFEKTLISLREFVYQKSENKWQDLMRKEADKVIAEGLKQIPEQKARDLRTKALSESIQGELEFAALGFMGGGLKPKIPKVTPKDLIKGEIKPIEKLIEVIKRTKPLRGAQERLYTLERAQRAAKLESIGQKLGGREGFYEELGALKGEFRKVHFDAIEKEFSQDEIKFLFNTIKTSKSLLPYEKLATQKALEGIFKGSLPTRGEIELLDIVFPKNLTMSLLSKRPNAQKVLDVIQNIANLPRAQMATSDLSFALRQAVLLVGKPKVYFPAFKDMFSYFAKEKAYVNLLKDIQSRETYRFMRRGKVAFTDLGTRLSTREEQFMTNWIEKVPGWGKVARASNRAYSGMANKLRADLFDVMYEATRATGRKLTDKDLIRIGRFVNIATGRGNLPEFLERAAPALNATFFSPRLMSSRLQMLYPGTYINLPAGARKEALKTLLGFATITATVFSLAKLNGLDVETPPPLKVTNSDDYKIKTGNTRYDIMGGLQQYMKIVSQLWQGEIESSTTGRTYVLGEGFGMPNRKDIMIKFLESKENPIVSLLVGLLTDENWIGEEFDFPAEVIDRFIPMVVSDLYDLSQDRDLEKAIPMWLPAVFGVGLQTYGKAQVRFGEKRIEETDISFPSAEITLIPRLSDKIRELVLGEVSIGESKGFAIETYYDQLSNLPREDAAKIFDDIKEVNPKLAKKINKIVKERELGITAKDKDLKAKPVGDGTRAVAIWKIFEALKTKEKKAQLWNEYVIKGIITKKVAAQLKQIAPELFRK